MIDFITKMSWTQPNGKNGYCYHVYHKSGRHICYTWKMNLPMTVTNFLLADDTVVCDTTYIDCGDRWKKREVFVKEVV